MVTGKDRGLYFKPKNLEFKIYVIIKQFCNTIEFCARGWPVFRGQFFIPLTVTLIDSTSLGLLLDVPPPSVAFIFTFFYVSCFVD